MTNLSGTVSAGSLALCKDSFSITRPAESLQNYEVRTVHIVACQRGGVSAATQRRHNQGPFSAPTMINTRLT